MTQKENCSVSVGNTEASLTRVDDTFPVPMELGVERGLTNATSMANCECGCDLGEMSSGLLFVGSSNCSLNTTLKWSLRAREPGRYFLDLTIFGAKESSSRTSTDVLERFEVRGNDEQVTTFMQKYCK
jgi:hypothetical protein